MHVFKLTRGHCRNLNTRDGMSENSPLILRFPSNNLKYAIKFSACDHFTISDAPGRIVLYGNYTVLRRQFRGRDVAQVCCGAAYQHLARGGRSDREVGLGEVCRMRVRDRESTRA